MTAEKPKYDFNKYDRPLKKILEEAHKEFKNMEKSGKDVAEYYHRLVDLELKRKLVKELGELNVKIKIYNRQMETLNDSFKDLVGKLGGIENILGKRSY